MIAVRDLDDALRFGTYRLGRLTTRAVRCAACGVDCLPGQAQQVYLSAREWRTVRLCLTCIPKGAKE